MKPKVWGTEHAFKENILRKVEKLEGIGSKTKQEKNGAHQADEQGPKH